MQTIPLQAIPNQTFRTTLDQVLYEITLKTIGDRVYASIKINGTDTIDSVQCMPNQQLLPYQYLEGVGGNFAWSTPNDEYPDSDNFGSTHFLLYASVAELETFRGS